MPSTSHRTDSLSEYILPNTALPRFLRGSLRRLLYYPTSLSKTISRVYLCYSQLTQGGRDFGVIGPVSYRGCLDCLHQAILYDAKTHPVWARLGKKNDDRPGLKQCRTRLRYERIPARGPCFTCQDQKNMRCTPYRPRKGDEEPQP